MKLQSIIWVELLGVYCVHAAADYSIVMHQICTCIIFLKYIIGVIGDASDYIPRFGDIGSVLLGSYAVHH